MPAINKSQAAEAALSRCLASLGLSPGRGGVRPGSSVMSNDGSCSAGGSDTPSVVDRMYIKMEQVRPATAPCGAILRRGA